MTVIVKKPEEIRITQITNGKTYTWYEVCIVFGLLDTHTVQKAFPTVKAAREFIKETYSDASPRIPVIVQ